MATMEALELIGLIRLGEDSRTQFKKTITNPELPIARTTVGDLDMEHFGDYFEK